MALSDSGIEMDKTDERCIAYLNILKEELIPAMGCTEPIAIAYAAARARETFLADSRTGF